MSLFEIHTLDERHRVSEFRCGEPVLDDYLRRYATQDIRRNITRVFVASPEGDSNVVAGYFTLCAASIAASTLPEALRRKLPRYPVPVALLGRLAVSDVFQGKGLGAILLADACQKVMQASHVLAVAGLIVDAKDDSTAKFYRHFGFVELPGQPDRLLLPASAMRT